ncbi:testicular haploid expressed gene protein-like isoform X1 [Eublepharis macularius]|uniref:Testicular haploid expressed gene protein-like isoform X1 n=1 Tax=Eublepharis macularius TaxID=481883 RepID=A0AA97JQ20_EUBMA|nr:testicular haploid expressed gene protein-like isoform X1 [Eublepharis macularius]
MAAVSPHGFHSSERIQRLAEPKKTKDVWNYSSKLVWGNQETIWPLSKKALTDRPNQRTLDLAKPKKDFNGKHQRRPLYVFSCGRESEIWERPPDLYDLMPSERLLHLSEPRRYSPVYLKQRPRSSPLWSVSPMALSCKASQRILDLSQPRSLCSSFTLPKESETQVTKAALTAAASARTKRLAQPIIKKSILCYDNRYMEAPVREVNPAALQAVASPRTAELARPKALPTECSPDRDAQWPVSLAARKAAASLRMEELAQPPRRAPTNFVQFNPEAFTVKETAKKAVCTDRVKKLAEPIMR